MMEQDKEVFVRELVSNASVLQIQFLQKIVNLFFILAIVKDKLTDLCGN